MEKPAAVSGKAFEQRKQRAQDAAFLIKTLEPARILCRLRAEEKKFVDLLNKAMELGPKEYKAQCAYAATLATIRDQIAEYAGIPRRPVGRKPKMEAFEGAIEAETVPDRPQLDSPGTVVEPEPAETVPIPDET